MKLNLEKLDEFIKNHGNEAPSVLWVDASTFNPAKLPNDEPRPAGAAGNHLSNGGLLNSNGDADVIAHQYLNSAYDHIDNVLSEGFDSIDQYLDKVDELTKGWPFLKDVFKANDRDGSTTGDQVDGKMIDDIGREIMANGKWREPIREKLRALEKELSKQLKKIKKACEDELNNLTTMKENLARYWGKDSLVVAGLIWSARIGLTCASLYWPGLSWWIGAASVTLNAVAKIFCINNVSEAALGVAEAEDVEVEEKTPEKVETREKLEQKKVENTPEKTVEKEPEAVETEVEKPVKNDVDDRQVEIGSENGENVEVKEGSYSEKTPEKEVEKREKIEQKKVVKTPEKTPEKEPEAVETEIEKTVKNDVDDRQVEVRPENGENVEMEEDSIIKKRSVENNNDNVEPPSKKAKQEEMQIIN